MSKQANHRTWERPYFYILIPLLSFVLSFLVGESVTADLFSSNRIEELRKHSLQYHRANIVRYTLKPSQVVRPDGNRVWYINEHGLRGESFSLEKPKFQIRIIIIGGSAVFDQNASGNLHWPKLIENALHAKGYTM